MFIRFFISLIAFVATAMAFGTQSLEFIERPLLEQRFRLVQSEADSRLVIVEIDPKSLRKIGIWPWKRSLHALLVDRLTAAGVERIVFDIDFSLASSESQDALLESAFARRSGRTVLAAFRQWSASERRFVDVGPLPRFARHVEIASATVFPEYDGHIWRMPLAQEWNDGSIASIPRRVAMRDGETFDSVRPAEDFWIDFGIEIDTIQRYSFIDVASGLVDPDLLKDKTVLVGATAVELGDNFAAPLHKSLPGVLIQMLAAQSLIMERALQPVAFPVSLLLLFLLTSFIAVLHWGQRAGQAVLTLVVCNVLAFAAAVVVQTRLGLLLPIAPLIVGSILTGALVFIFRSRQLGMKVVSERLARLKSQAVMANVAENAFAALITMDEAGRITTFNRAAEKIFRIGRKQAEGRCMSTFYVPSKLGNHMTFCRFLELAASSDEPVRVVFRRATGRAFLADLAVTRMTDDSGGELILMLQDIDRLMKAEKRIQQTERELRSAKLKAETANRAKTEFLANMSHELKTPLNAVMGFAEIMQNEIYGPLGSPHYADYSSDIYNSGARLLATVNDVLDFARVEDGRLDLQETEVDLSDLIRRMGTLMQERVETAGLELTIEVPEAPVIYRADQRLMKQSIAAILSNAIKFNREHGQVAVLLRIGDNGEARLSVSDSGIGIPAERIESCFDAFGQVDSSLKRHYEGAGLGLTLAKAYVESHGGACQIESVVGEGTTVTLSLPAERRYIPKISIAG